MGIQGAKALTPGEGSAVASFLEPMQCLAVTKLPEGEARQYELKLDGFRTLAVKHAGQLSLFSRNKKTFNRRFPTVVAALRGLPDESIIDGETVALDEHGRPSFNRLQNFSALRAAITFFAFDVVMWKGQDLQARPLHERRTLLQKDIMPTLPAVHYSESFVPLERMISVVRERSLEGIVAKNRHSRYEPGRRRGSWVKMRLGGRQEFVIAGYTPAAQNFDSILVGYWEGWKLIYASAVRNGFVPASRESLFRNFEKLRTATCPFANLPETKKGQWGEGLTAADMEKCIWLEPRLVAVIDYAEWTPANHLRHANFVGLREDKNPREVTRERPIPIA